MDRDNQEDLWGNLYPVLEMEETVHIQVHNLFLRNMHRVHVEESLANLQNNLELVTTLKDTKCLRAIMQEDAESSMHTVTDNVLY